MRLARAVVEDIEVDTVLRRVLESARELTGARYAAIGVLDESRTGLPRFMSSGVDDQTIRRIGAPPARTRGAGRADHQSGAAAPDRRQCASAVLRFPAGASEDAIVSGGSGSVGHKPYGNLYLAEKRDGAQVTARDEEAVVPG